MGITGKSGRTFRPCTVAGVIQDLDLKGYLGCTGFASCEMRGNDSFLMEPQKVETTADGSK